MKILLRVLPLFVCVSTHAAPIEGRLEIIWGDSAPGTPESSVQHIRLVDAQGRSLALDPDQARQAAGDIYQWFGKPVVVELGARRHRAGSGGRSHRRSARAGCSTAATRCWHHGLGHDPVQIQ